MQGDELDGGEVEWPPVQRVKRRGGCGLLVNAEVQGAIRTASAAALMH